MYTYYYDGYDYNGYYTYYDYDDGYYQYDSYYYYYYMSTEDASYVDYSPKYEDNKGLFSVIASWFNWINNILIIF